LPPKAGSGWIGKNTMLLIDRRQLFVSSASSHESAYRIDDA